MGRAASLATTPLSSFRSVLCCSWRVCAVCSAVVLSMPVVSASIDVCSTCCNRLFLFPVYIRRDRFFVHSYSNRFRVRTSSEANLAQHHAVGVAPQREEAPDGGGVVQCVRQQVAIPLSSYAVNYKMTITSARVVRRRPNLSHMPTMAASAWQPLPDGSAHTWSPPLPTPTVAASRGDGGASEHLRLRPWPTHRRPCTARLPG